MKLFFFLTRALGLVFSSSHPFLQNKQRADSLQLTEDYPLMALNGEPAFQKI